MLSPDVQILPVYCVSCGKPASIKFHPVEPVPWPRQFPMSWPCPDVSCGRLNTLVSARAIIRVWPRHEIEPAWSDDALELSDLSPASLQKEISSAMTFATLAKYAVDAPERRMHNRQRALAAYATVFRSTAKIQLTPEDATEIAERLRELKSLIEDIPY